MDFGERSVQIVLKDDPGRVMKEAKVGKDEERMLDFLDGTQAKIVMESGYNHQHIYDVLKERGCDVTAAHPFMVKAITYVRVKTDKVDARMLADLLRVGIIPEAYVPDEGFREVRDLVRRHYMVKLRPMLKNKIHTEMATRWIVGYDVDPRTGGHTCVPLE